MIFLAATALFAQDAAIEGIVRDSVSRAPVPGVVLELTGPETRTAISGAKGDFRFENLATGAYKLKYTIQGYLGSDARGASTVNLTKAGAIAQIPLEVTPFAKLEGVVLDEEGRPLPGVRVYTGFNYQDTTAADGRYTIEPLAPGTYSIVLRLPLELRRTTLKRDPESGETFGYANVEYYPGVTDQQASTPVTVTGGLDLRGFDIRLRRVRLVELSGHAHGAARVELAPPPDDTNEPRAIEGDGEFRFDLIQPGSYSLLAYRSTGKEAMPYILPIEVPKTGLRDQKIVIPSFASLQGSIVAPPEIEWSGKVMVHIHAAAPGLGGRIFNVTSERFTLDDIPPGKWILSVDSNALRQPQATKLFVESARFGAQSARNDPVVIAESGNPPLEIRLTSESCRISGTVVDANGLPRKNAILFISGAGNAAFLTTANTRDDGSFFVDGLVPGKYRIMVLDRGRTSTRDSIAVEVNFGAIATVRIVAPVEGK